MICEQIIVKAIHGDERALASVVRHYNRYIFKLALKKGYSAAGERYEYVDAELVGEMKTALMLGILKFKILK